ncbi:LOW QUALITY PROTEIN: hypothetical protein M513_00974 [Trichuris suis]|uniref:Uncharacterized protein n=1 Tax=Trichuris suis TaxID=68888 RepID=A0A085MLW5_9BILA|nr:LOW QUALITY PROTEIN: hypothetical protein M513_00974 [Trichuris suis]
MNFCEGNFEDHYVVHEDLGSGQFAVVRRCVHLSSGKQYAAKFITKRLFNGSQRGARRSDIEREIEVLREVGGHANIISLYEMYESKREVVLVLELVSGGELFHYLCSRESLCEEEASSFIRQILYGLHHMHSKLFAHLDLKPENIMLQKSNSTSIKLIDFGLSRRIPPNSSVKDLMGTEEFVAPETINYDGMTLATDMWALGVLTFVFGSSPFLGETRQETFCNISSVRYDFDSEYFASTSALAKDFIRHLLIRDPRKRYTAEECLKHPWIESDKLKYMAVRREAVISLQYAHSIEARRRWQMVICLVTFCIRLMKRVAFSVVSDQPELHKDVKSDQRGSLFFHPVRANIKFLSKLGWQPRRIIQSLQQVYGNSAPSKSVVYECIRRFKEGREAIEDDRRAGRPATATSEGTVALVRNLVEGDRRITIRRIARMAGISLHSAFGILHETLGLRKLSARWVPKALREEQLVRRVNLSRELLTKIEANETGFLTVSSWEMKRGSTNMTPRVRSNPSSGYRGGSVKFTAERSARKVMATIFWDSDEYALISDTDMCVSEKNHFELSNAYQLSGLDPSGSTGSAVVVAAATGNLGALKVLINEGAELHHLNNRGDSALHLAASAGQVNAVKYLIRKVNLNVLNTCKETPLHVAVRSGCVDTTLCLLMSEGIDVNARDMHGNSPLHIACLHGFTMIVSLLCNFKPNLSLRNKAGETPLICSTIRGHLDCAFALKAAGVDLGETDGMSRTALHLAILNRNTNLAQPLIESMDDLNLYDEANIQGSSTLCISDGNSPLHLACKEGLSTLVRNLCQRGMNVDHVNQLGNAPLHIACQQNHLDVVKQLCLAECNVNLKDKDGRTGEMIASARGHSEIYELLKRVKQDSTRQCYIKQLVPCTGQSLRRIKLKLFGHSGVGKTRLLESLRTGLLGNLFRRFSEQPVTTVDEVLETPATNVWRRAVVLPPNHGNCTAGIEVTTSSFPSCAEFSTWEFSGYPTYHFLYDRFIGNPNCIHLVLFRATDPTEVKYHSVLFWMSLLKSCFSPENCISKGGVSQHRAVVILVATHVDMAEPAYSQTPDGEWRSSEAEALLKTIKLRFCNEFLIHDSIILVDTLQPSSSGIRTLKSLLLHHRSLILERLPSTSGFLESAVASISQLRKQMVSFPVLRWPDFLRYLHQFVNPLSSEFHCQHLAEQLQQIGEIVCVRNDNVYAESDFIVLNPNWLCHEIIGRLLSYEFLRNCRPTGIYTTDEILQLFPTVSNIIEFSQLLEAVSLGTLIHSDGDDAFEFAPMNFSRPPLNHWEPVSTSLVYGGIRLVPRRGMDHLVRGVFLSANIFRVQNNLRRCSQQSKSPLDIELIQWQGGSKMSRGMIEGLLLLLNREHCLELRVRGPTDLNTDCFYFFEEIVSLIERTVFDVSPGILLERHFLSPNDLLRHCPNVCVYTPNRIIEMQLEENVFIHSADRKEQFLDIVCFGSREVAMSLKLGIDLKITAIPNSARRELASLLDPVDTMGRDWSILGAHLGLGNQLAEIESACGPEASTTDRVLSEWFLRNKDGATVGALLRCLKTMGRQDAVDILYRSIAPYLFVPINCDFTDARNDSGVESHNSRSTVDTPDRSASTVST